jgi:hypothetical protein
MKHTYTDWYNRILSYERAFKKWEGRADKILKRYRDDSRTQNNPNARFNILYSNVQTITPAVFARLPRPDVTRRFKDNDPIGRVACMLLERALEYELEHYTDYKTAMDSSVFDRMIGGRGTAWIRYEPHIVASEQGLPEDGLEVSDVVDDMDENHDENQASEPGEMQEEIEYECAPVDYIHWRDFGHSVGRTWEEVTWVYRKVYMNRNALVERFGEELGYEIPLDMKPEEGKSYTQNQNMPEQALIYEIWDKETGDAIWLSKSMGKILDEKPDPLELEGFFPCPKPLYSNITTENLEPIPDFTMYQDQAKELDTLADRIDGLINALKVRGVFDASASELNRLFSEGENNTLIPVKNWGAFAEKQGLRGAIDLIDIQPFASALMSCYQAMDQVKGQIYEIMGIADIQRGQTDPNETLGAQIIKSNNAAGRLKTMQHNVVNFATKILNLKAQIICKHFTEETIVRISGAAQLSDQDKQLVPQALMLLKDESAKNFRIEVTSDSMIYQDEMQEKQDRMEFLQAVGNFMQNIIPLGQNAPELVPVAMEMLKFGVTGFKVGKGLEGLIDETADKLKEMAAQPRQPQPNPEMMKIQAQSQAKQAEMQMSAQIEQQKIQAQMQAETNKQQMQAQENSLRNQLEHERQVADREMEMKLAQMKMMTERNTQLLLAYINNGAKVEVARIGKSLDDGALAFDEYQNDADMLQAQEHPLAPIANAISQSNQQMTDTIGQLIGTLQEQHAMSNRPKQVIRDEQGKIVGVQ